MKRLLAATALVHSLGGCRPPDMAAREEASARAAQRFAGEQHLAVDVTQGSPVVVELGLGARVTYFADDYARCRSQVLFFGDRSIAELRARCESGGFERTQILERGLPSGWRRVEAEGGESYQLTLRDDRVFAKLVGARNTVLGAAPEVEVPEALLPSYRLLTDPFEVGTVSSSCGDSATVPGQYTAIEALVSARRLDLLRLVLRSPNPSGRAYAANALWRLDAISREDATTIDALAAERGEISTCKGCRVERQSYRHFFGASYRGDPASR